MQLCIFTEPQVGATYEDVLTCARATQDAGFDGFFRSDHLQSFDGDGMPGSTDAWTTLAGLARETSRIRLGTLVSPGTFRYPGLLAVQVAQVDHMSGGRVELGLGTGWYEQEHASYGLPFGTLAERFDRFEEQLQVVEGLWSTPVGERFSFAGKHYTLTDSPALPKPVQQPLPVIVGGGGKRRTPALAARYATEFNIGFCTVEEAARRLARVRAACEEIGRDPVSLRLSFAGTTAAGDSAAQAAVRAASIGADLDELRSTGFAATPREILARIAELEDLGISRIYLQLQDLRDLAHLDLLAEHVRPHVT